MGIIESHPDAPEVRQALVSSDAPLDVKADLATLGVVLSKIPAALRVPWMLRHVEGHELTEVAALCNCSLATAKRRIFAAESRVARRFGSVGVP